MWCSHRCPSRMSDTTVACCSTSLTIYLTPAAVKFIQLVAQYACTTQFPISVLYLASGTTKLHMITSCCCSSDREKGTSQPRYKQYLINYTLFWLADLNYMFTCNSPTPTASSVQPSPTLTFCILSNSLYPVRIFFSQVMWLDAPESINQLSGHCY